ncbi:MAG: type IV pilus secretin PilQ [Deltaproteobacteria bacterium]|nr:type IV pilus secretin PilQ [Deltaproteobacteria bacterium]
MKHPNPHKKMAALWILSFILGCASAPKPELQEQEGPNEIRSIDLSQTPQGWEVIVEGSRSPVFTVFEVEGSNQVTLDLNSAVWVGEDPPPIIQDSDVGVKVLPLSPELGEIVRVEVHLAQSMAHEARVDGNKVVLFLEGEDKTAEVETKEEEAPHGASSVVSVEVGGGEDQVEIRFTREGEGGSFHSFEMIDPNRLVIDLPGAVLKTKKQKYVVEKGGISQVRLGSSNGGVRLVLDTKKSELPPYQISEEGNQLVVMAGIERPKEEISANPVVPSTPKPAPVTTLVPVPQPSQNFEELEPREKEFIGRKISLDLKDADIQNVLRLIAEVSQLNVIAGEDVEGKVTMRLVDVPWDQALEVILSSSGLGQKRMGNVVRIAPLETLREEEAKELEAMRSKEKLEELVMKVLPVNYADAEEIQEQVKPLLSERGSLKVDSRTNALVVKDIPSVVDEMRALLHRLDQATPQVMIEARIVQVTSNLTEELGVQWGGSYGEGDVSVTGGNAGGAGAPTTPDFAVNLPTTTTPAGSLGVLLGQIGDTALLDLRLSALESTGKAKIISTPRVATLDNREATIQQGVTIPFETTSSLGTTTIFIDATLTLKVTPHITADRSVIMKITVERNAPDTSIDTQGAGPAISKRSANTEVLVKDRETTVIGGIFEVTDTTAVTKVPVLGDIPVIGWLFRRRSVDQDKSELLVFITPKVMTPPPQI